MTFNFEKLEVWKLSLKYIDTIYRLALEDADSQAQLLAKKIHAFRRALSPKSKIIREQSENYLLDGEL